MDPVVSNVLNDDSLGMLIPQDQSTAFVTINWTRLGSICDRGIRSPSISTSSHGPDHVAVDKHSGCCPRLVYRRLSSNPSTSDKINHPVLQTGFIILFAEVEGFEPPVPFPTLRFSRPVHSTTLPYLQMYTYSSVACIIEYPQNFSTRYLGHFLLLLPHGR